VTTGKMVTAIVARAWCDTSLQAMIGNEFLGQWHHKRQIEPRQSQAQWRWAKMIGLIHASTARSALAHHPQHLNRRKAIL
jgi:hypothetical protein